jgi:hypothetical protein
MLLTIPDGAITDAETLTSRKPRITLSDQPLAMQGTDDMNMRKDFLRNHKEIESIAMEANSNRPNLADFVHVTVNIDRDEQKRVTIAVLQRMNTLATYVCLRGTARIHTRGQTRIIADLSPGQTWTLPTTKERIWGDQLQISPTTPKTIWLELRTGEGMRCKDCQNGPDCGYKVCGFSNHENL